MILKFQMLDLELEWVGKNQQNVSWLSNDIPKVVFVLEQKLHSYLKETATLHFVH